MVCADGQGSGARMASVLRDAGINATLFDTDVPDGELLKPGVRIIVEPLDRGLRLPRPPAWPCWPRAI